jgi:hypothetical protein
MVDAEVCWLEAVLLDRGALDALSLHRGGGPSPSSPPSPSGQGGVRVAAVEPGSELAAAGVEAGMLLGVVQDQAVDAALGPAALRDHIMAQDLPWSLRFACARDCPRPPGAFKRP